MNSFITRILRPQSLREFVKSNVHKRYTATAFNNGALFNVSNRLRVEEDQYSNYYSSPIQQPYKDVLELLEKRTEKDFANAHMLMGNLQSKFMCQLIKFFKPKNILEIGGFTGCSAIAMGSCLPPNAKLMTLELDAQCVKVAREYIEMAQLQDKVFVKEGPGLNSLDDLIKESPSLKYDFIFLDADKGNYKNYYELIMKHGLLSDHGVLIADNTLFYGLVHRHVGFEKEIDPQLGIPKSKKEEAAKVHDFNEFVSNDPRVRVLMLPLFDGLSIIYKNKSL
ncbi:hypothetical protein G6F46_009433 [Rhizopus delemar]|nr:hypothetical protein G6F54_008917 [Rhizopus delemar]KAG1507032.1 hypothetical protein G6F53_009250 [Rhizopus delemar]KAG1584975.1 hypothetical protein G6F48_007561 [Rhizopus delemar]KAG1597992.1 hypothetical protein G6F47_006818 [Rhizopus delemar]KAG1611209.1 hypothetical protein G6F46_009433 [Rhizopus delemar]